MSIFRAIGFGIFIMIMGLMLPDVLDAGRATAISFLRGARISADTATNIAASAASARPSASPLPPLRLPQATNIPPY